MKTIITGEITGGAYRPISATFRKEFTGLLPVPETLQIRSHNFSVTTSTLLFNPLPHAIIIAFRGHWPNREALREFAETACDDGWTVGVT